MKTPASIFCSVIFFFFAACSSNKHESAEMYPSADSSMSVSGMRGDSIKLVKTAGMTIKVKNIYESSRTISEKARVLGGIVTHHNIETFQDKEKNLQISADSVLVISAYSTHADITVKVPTDNLEKFMNEIASVATFTLNSRLDIEDKSIDYLASSMKQKIRQELLIDGRKKAVKTADATALIEKEDGKIDQEINKRRIDADVRYSAVSLNLIQPPLIQKEVIANSDLSVHNLPISQRVSNAFYSGWHLFISFFVALVHLWVFILLGLVFWMGFRFYKAKHTGMIHNSKQ
ncbi:uncharacterized protein DUF4349 [Arcticibacter tournemirensis]|uniref:DUF4349 domain-containing protein n=1 Tax=Arcticibacter tournemirensis TaxID=699437 RepID=A0A5M9H0Z2_9SPHI|nr:DUF4349 domain-containing protein [Arcticibacter tournemirensis]KAA8479735.1 DUF4349 domain-containing protein [Arcticibacter tournemirensis]TQM50236.1 uncharacterized protein DUF4349 [Arcticibacter tournemirensis]